MVKARIRPSDSISDYVYLARGGINLSEEITHNYTP